MKIIVTHKASDLDAIASSWVIKKFLPGWEEAKSRFVPAGEKLIGKYISQGEAIEKVDTNGKTADVIHVDTGMGKLDHHQTEDTNICATSLAFDYVLVNNPSLAKNEIRVNALKRIVDYVIDDDHFQEVFYPNPSADVYDFTIVGLIMGIKIRFPKDDETCMKFGMDLMDSAFHFFENKVWAENEMKEKGIEFTSRFGKSLAIETINDAFLKLAQEHGYILAVRKDSSTGSIRIKARPKKRIINKEAGIKRNGFEDVDVDLTPVYEKLKQMDPDATWFLHASKRMLLNGSSKNPNMKGTKLTLSEVVEVLQNL